MLNGIAELTISRTVITAQDTTEIDAELVRVQSIKSVSSGVEYQILNFVQGGGLVRFFGNPIPQAGEKFFVDYLYASDYGIFLSRLSKKIQELKDS